MAAIEESTQLGWPELLPTEHLTAVADQDGASSGTALGWPTADPTASSRSAGPDAAGAGRQPTRLAGTGVAGVAAIEAMPDRPSTATAHASRATASVGTASVESGTPGDGDGQAPVSRTRPDRVSRETPTDPVALTSARRTVERHGHQEAASDGPERDVSRGTESATDSADASGPASQTPIADEVRAEARRRQALTGRRMAAPQRTRVVTVSNQKGGVGKTTSVVNLAAAMALSGLNVLVLDIDPQGNASTALGVDHHADVQGVYDVLVEGTALDSVVVACPNIPRLWCAPATIDLAGAEIELVSLVAREMRLKRAVDAYLDSRKHDGHDRIDYVLIDCPPSLGLLTVNALVAGQEVLIPIQCEYYALEGLSQLMKNIEMIRSHLNPTLEVSTILMTMYDGRTRLSAQVADDVRTHFPEQVLKSTVPRSVRISEAPSHGQTVMTYDPSSSGALSYLEAAFEMAARGG